MLAVLRSVAPLDAEFTIRLLLKGEHHWAAADGASARLFGRFMPAF